MAALRLVDVLRNLKVVPQVKVRLLEVVKLLLEAMEVSERAVAKLRSHLDMVKVGRDNYEYNVLFFF